MNSTLNWSVGEFPLSNVWSQRNFKLITIQKCAHSIHILFSLFHKGKDKCPKERCCSRTLTSTCWALRYGFELIVFWWIKKTFLQVVQMTLCWLMLPLRLCTPPHQVHQRLLLFIYLTPWTPPQRTNQSTSQQRRNTSAHTNKSHHERFDLLPLPFKKRKGFEKKQTFSISHLKAPVHQSKTWWIEKVIVLPGVLVIVNTWWTGFRALTIGDVIRALR